MELDAALLPWVAAEQSLEFMVGSSTERDVENMTAKVLTAVGGDFFFAADRAEKVFVEAATPPGATMQQACATGGDTQR